MERILLGTCGETEELLLGKHLKKSLRTCIDILKEGHTPCLRRDFGLQPSPAQSRYTSEINEFHRRTKLRHIPEGTVAMNSDTDQLRALLDTH